MTDVIKNSKAISFLSIALIPILFTIFYGAVNWYENSAFNSYLVISKDFEESQNINYTIRTIIDIYNDSLIDILIMPIFFAAGLSLFANYVFHKRINFLETELKEIKEKIDA